MGLVDQDAVVHAVGGRGQAKRLVHLAPLGRSLLRSHAAVVLAASVVQLAELSFVRGFARMQVAIVVQPWLL